MILEIIVFGGLFMKRLIMKNLSVFLCVITLIGTAPM